MKERLQAFFARKAALPVLCYALAAAGWLLWGVYARLDDTGLRAGQTSLPVDAFTLTDLEPDPDVQNGYLAASGDPQMLWENTDGRKLRTVSYVPEFLGGEPREMCLYYTTRSGEAFSRDKRVFPRVLATGRYVYTLPHGKIAALRLDPCSPAESDDPVTVVFMLDAIDLNYGPTLPRGWQYFVPDVYTAFCLLLYPALAAALLDWLRAVWRHIIKDPVR